MSDTASSQPSNEPNPNGAPQSGEGSDAHAETAPPRRSRIGLWIALAVVMVLVLGVVGALGVPAFMRQRRLNEVRTDSAKIDAGIQKIRSSSADLDKQWQLMWITTGDPKGAQVMIDKTAQTTSDLLAQTAALNTVADGLQSSAIAAEYHSTLNELSTALTSYKNQDARAGAKLVGLPLAAKAAKALEQGYANSNASIQAANARNYKDALIYATLETKSFTAAKKAFTAARAVDPSAIDNSYVDYANQLLVRAAMEKHLAALGKQGAGSAYNAQIAKIDALTNKIDQMPAAGPSDLSVQLALSDIERINGKLSASIDRALLGWGSVQQHVAAGEL